MTPSLARDGAHNLAVGDILGNVIIIKPTPRAYFFKFHERGLEGASRFHQILSINISPKSTLMLISRCDGNILVFKEYVEVISVMNVLEDLEVVSKAKKLPNKATKSPPKTSLSAAVSSPKSKFVVKKEITVKEDGKGEVEHNNTDDDDDANVSKEAEILEEKKMYQLHAELTLRPLGVAPIQCCSISDAGM